MPPRIKQAKIQCTSRSLSYAPVFKRCTRSQCQHIRPFGSTPQCRSKLRNQMFDWLDGPGSVFKDPLPGSTNYINAYDKRGRLLRATGQSDEASTKVDARKDDPAKARDDEDLSEVQITPKIASQATVVPKESGQDLEPFPMNRQFRSQAVLSEELREEIWKRVVVQGQSIRHVSAELKVEMRRVGAVVRLKSVEKQWQQQGKPLATPYASAILSMLPTTPCNYPKAIIHEPINDLPVHAATLPQIFHPVSESRAFTRVDAGKVFDSHLLPADGRIPHPELIEDYGDLIYGHMTGPGLEAKRRERMKKELKSRAEIQERQRKREGESVQKVVPRESRWEWRFRDMSVEDVGEKGRGLKGVGARYGVPPQDRKRGQVKIPTRVV